jgi:hypothetical protein
MVPGMAERERLADELARRDWLSGTALAPTRPTVRISVAQPGAARGMLPFRCDVLARALASRLHGELTGIAIRLLPRESGAADTLARSIARVTSLPARMGRRTMPCASASHAVKASQQPSPAQ